MTERTQLAIRMERELLERVDQVAEQLAARFPGMNTSRSDVVRILINRGLEVLEAETSDKAAGNE